MKGREILGRAVEVVVFLFAMFGSFLTNIAPPEGVANFAVGLASFLALILLLFVSVLARGRFPARRRKVWTAVAGVLAVVAVTAGLIYQRHLGRLTFFYPPESSEAEHRRIRGTSYTQDAQALADQGLTPGQVLARFGPDYIYRVWTEESIENAQTVLTVDYLVLVLSLSGTIFSLVEIYLAGEKTSATRKASSRSRSSSKEEAPAQTDPTSRPAAGGRALALWQEKLDFLKEQEAITSDPAQKYTLRKQIEEAEEKIRELTR